MNTTTLLDRLLDFELALRAYYGWLSRKFRGYEVISKLFFRLGREEEAHANLIRCQQALAQQCRLGNRNLELDDSEIDLLISEIDAFQNRDDCPDLVDALALAKRLEQFAAETIHSSALSRSVPELKGLLASLSGDDLRHLGLLRQIEDAVAGRLKSA